MQVFPREEEGIGPLWAYVVYYDKVVGRERDRIDQRVEIQNVFRKEQCKVVMQPSMGKI